MNYYLDANLSAQAARYAEAKPKACYRNAFMAMLMPGLENARYIEGHIALPERLGRIVLSHGWLELPYGKVIDPTLWRDEGNTYFPGIRFDLAEVLRILNTRPKRQLPLYLHFVYPDDRLLQFNLSERRGWLFAIPPGPARDLLISQWGLPDATTD